jgi:hypothetical protein
MKKYPNMENSVQVSLIDLILTSTLVGFSLKNGSIFFSMKQYLIYKEDSKLHLQETTYLHEVHDSNNKKWL